MVETVWVRKGVEKLGLPHEPPNGAQAPSGEATRHPPPANFSGNSFERFVTKTYRNRFSTEHWATIFCIFIFFTA